MARRSVKWAAPFAVMLTIVGFGTEARAEGEWEYMFAPYIWGAGMDGATSIGPVTSEIDLSFGDILETLDGGFLGHFEASNDPWTILANLVFLDLRQDLDRPQGSANIEQTIFELGGAFSTGEDLEVLFGARLVDIDVQIDLFGPLGNLDARIDGAKTWTDPFIGGRWSPEISDRWSFQGRADIGGFGVGSELTWNAALLFRYRASEKVDIGLGYRIMDIDYEDDDGRRFAYDAQLPGALLGVGFKF